MRFITHLFDFSVADVLRVGTLVVPQVKTYFAIIDGVLDIKLGHLAIFISGSVNPLLADFSTHETSLLER